MNQLPDSVKERLALLPVGKLTTLDEAVVWYSCSPLKLLECPNGIGLVSRQTSSQHPME